MGHSPMSGVYTSLPSFLDATLKVLGDDILSEPLRLEVKHIFAMPIEGGTYVAVELAAINSKGQNGMTYDQRYCWIVKYGDDEMVHEARAYLDTDLLTRVIEQNAKK
jgi:ketosteroid isomerase-like protein